MNAEFMVLFGDASGVAVTTVQLKEPVSDLRESAVFEGVHMNPIRSHVKYFLQDISLIRLHARDN